MIKELNWGLTYNCLLESVKVAKNADQNQGC